MDIAQYLKRLCITEVAVDLPTLNLIHSQHLQLVTFGSLAIHQHEPIKMDIEHLFRRIIIEHKDGLCFEINYLLFTLLQALGFKVHLLQAQIFKGDGIMTPECNHLICCVDLHGVSYVVDVAVGDSFRYPLKIELDEVQSQMDGHYSIIQSLNNKLLVQRMRDGKNTNIMMFDLKVRSIEEFKPIVKYYECCPYSFFVQKSFLFHMTPNGNKTLMGSRLIITEFKDGGLLNKSTTELDQPSLLSQIKEMGVCWEQYTPVDSEILMDPTLVV